MNKEVVWHSTTQRWARQSFQIRKPDETKRESRNAEKTSEQEWAGKGRESRTLVKGGCIYGCPCVDDCGCYVALSHRATMRYSVHGLVASLQGFLTCTCAAPGSARGQEEVSLQEMNIHWEMNSERGCVLLA